MKPWLPSRPVRHALFWAAMPLFFFLIQLPAHVAIGTELQITTLLLNHLPVALLATYPLLYVVLPRLLRQQAGVFLWLLAGWLVATVVLTGLMQACYERVVAPGLFGSAPGPAFHWATLLELRYSFFTLMVTAGGAVAIKVANGWYEQRRHEQQLLQRKLRTELELLKARLQPTFLFNTLRTLQALTAQKAPESPAAVLHLSALLRYLLYESQLAEVPLAEEVALVRHYVALERLRLGTRVEVSLSFGGALEAHTIAPLLLLPFVENAFRHAADVHQDCPWVSLDLVARKNSFTLKVISSQPQPQPGPGEETGLGSVRERLARLYPGQHELKMVADPDTFLVVLRLRRTPVPPPERPGSRPAAASEVHLNA